MAIPLSFGLIQALDSNGDPISGALLHSYVSGTVTAKTTYSDSGLTVANANPLVADSSGRFGPIYLGTGAYKFVLEDADSVTLETVDPVSQPVDTDSLLSSSGYWRKLQSDTSLPYFQLGNMRIWYDATNDRVRYKIGSDPSSETDGSAIGATFDDAFNETGLLDLGGFKIWRQADGQWRSKSGGPSSADDGTLLSNLFSGDFNAGDTDILRLNRSGTVYRLWIDANGEIRLHSSVPASDTDGTVVGASSGLQQGDLLDTSSGTSVTTSDLGVVSPKRITMVFDSVSMDGTDDLEIQIGDSGGIETSGYVSSSAEAGNGSGGTVSSTNGFILQSSAAARIINGNAMLTNVSGNRWVWSFAGGLSTGTIGGLVSGGVKELTGSLTQVRIKPAGSDNLDGGQVRIFAEG